MRSFNGSPLGEKDKHAMQAYIDAQKNPFGVPIVFRLLEAKAYGLSSPVIVGEDTYLAAKVSTKQKYYEIAFGYSFEAACLYAQSLGLGTVMLAASLSRTAFETAMELGENEVLPLASPIGYPAEKKSIREALMRKALKADERISFEALFFKNDFSVPLRKSDAGVFSEALEMARRAPSAANKQPWRAVVQDDTVHFYENKTMKESTLGDVQKVDIGIALSHFDLTMQEEGHSGKFIESDPHLETPENHIYIVSYERKS
ncbi:MAG: nitroreductase family protein [Clostridia bacterium]|nr:nitroreductase family protein [Clostridia bacterium]